MLLLTLVFLAVAALPSGFGASGFRLLSVTDEGSKPGENGDETGLDAARSVGFGEELITPPVGKDT